MNFFDVVIVGSGAAGLSVALNTDRRLKVAVLSKAVLTEANTYYAQGGVAAVLNQHDSMSAHVGDTLRVGAGLCRAEVVRNIIEQGPLAINWLQQQGVVFTTEEGSEGLPHLTQEGGHSHRRVWHVADATGVAISKKLIEQARQMDHITWFENVFAIDLIVQPTSASDQKRVVGLYVFDQNTHAITTLGARYIVLATGGASKAYLYTSNPDVATGDGIAMAWRAGCRVANMEFNQFHPTCLYHAKAPCFLISEAMRGEGARLLGENLQPFMAKYDSRLELAPRDIVARAIDNEMKSRGLSCVWLDISYKSVGFIKKQFPMLHHRLLALGIDITQEPIPVVPAAHYTCGGVLTDINGQTDIQGLFAIGEAACTGLHGANRMASNSLLECLVLGFSSAREINRGVLPRIDELVLPQWDDSRVTSSDENVIILHNWHELRQCMWDYVGIVRTNKFLQRAKSRVDLLKAEVAEFYVQYKINADLLELRNLVLVSELIILSAMQRKESRGLHFNSDYQETLSTAKDTLLTPPFL